MPNSNRSQASGQTRTVALADRMRLTQLKLIMALGEDGTLGRAAATINVTQPTATKMQAEFEAILGVALYERRPRGLHATAPWADIAPFARALAGVRPDRVVWRSNWPHPIRFREMPDDSDLLDALAE